MDYPVKCTTDLQKTEYVTLALEKLRREHNSKGAEYLKGTIKKSEWESYLKNVFFPASKKLCAELNKARKSLKVDVEIDGVIGKSWTYDKKAFANSKTYTVDLKAI